MGVLKTIYKGNQRRCPSCINMIYAGDCAVVATIDAEVPNDMIPPGVAKKPVPLPLGSTPRNTSLIVKDTILKKAPPNGSVKQARARRIEAESLGGELYTLTQATRICPICKYPLPPTFDTVKSMTIAVIGDTTSGKSLYISALIKQIQAGGFVRSDQQMSFRCLTPDIEKYYIQNYFEPLFIHKQRLPASQQLAEITHKPLIYELFIRSTKNRPSRTLNLILYDTAGEDYVIQERLVSFTRYVLHADAIIFLADPITMPEIIDRLPPGVNYDTAPGRSATDGFNKIMAQVKRLRGATDFHAIPVAITLSKSDLLKYMIPIGGQYDFLIPGEYKGLTTLRDLEKTNRDVRDFIERFGERTLLQAPHSSKKTHFFATSATGYPPDANGFFPAVEPNRCLDPLLWILYELKVIFNDKPF